MDINGLVPLKRCLLEAIEALAKSSEIVQSLHIDEAFWSKKVDWKYLV